MAKNTPAKARRPPRIPKNRRKPVCFPRLEISPPNASVAPIAPKEAIIHFNVSRNCARPVSKGSDETAETAFAVPESPDGAPLSLNDLNRDLMCFGIPVHVEVMDCDDASSRQVT